MGDRLERVPGVVVLHNELYVSVASGEAGVHCRARRSLRDLTSVPGRAMCRGRGLCVCAPWTVHQRSRSRARSRAQRVSAPREQLRRRRGRSKQAAWWSRRRGKVREGTHIQLIVDLDTSVKRVREVERPVIILERRIAHVIVDCRQCRPTGDSREKRCMGLPVVGWAYGPSAASLGASVVKRRRGVKRA